MTGNEKPDFDPEIDWIEPEPSEEYLARLKELESRGLLKPLSGDETHLGPISRSDVAGVRREFWDDVADEPRKPRTSE